MLSDIAALIIAFVSVRMAPKSWDKNTYGWARAEVLGKYDTPERYDRFAGNLFQNVLTPY